GEGRGGGGWTHDAARESRPAGLPAGHRILASPGQEPMGSVVSRSNVAIGLRDLRKAFAATIAVDNVSFDVAEGTVHALLGENGAGKSTIVKLLSGLILPDAGVIRIFGSETRLASPRGAHRQGIQTAFQEMTLI